MPPSLVTYGEKLPAARAGGSSRPDEPSAIVAAMRAIAARNPAAGRPGDLVFMGCASWTLGKRATNGPPGCDRRLMSAGIQAANRPFQEKPFPRPNPENSP